MVYLQCFVGNIMFIASGEDPDFLYAESIAGSYCLVRT